ncbi:hypothetical protein E2C01_076468 [Portunus trituberculatus]|uniref:Uncharacterized protein n=1 Tax=Portunus trituberculatus TaxID=210409 RepID=A0A5B7IDA4_PORTR|nr:hypothetical protein [Portunus trituberculatus]
MILINKGRGGGDSPAPPRHHGRPQCGSLYVAAVRGSLVPVTDMGVRYVIEGRCAYQVDFPRAGGRGGVVTVWEDKREKRRFQGGGRDRGGGTGSHWWLRPACHTATQPRPTARALPRDTRDTRTTAARVGHLREYRRHIILRRDNRAAATLSPRRGGVAGRAGAV